MSIGVDIAKVTNMALFGSGSAVILSVGVKMGASADAALADIAKLVDVEAW